MKSPDIAFYEALVQIVPVLLVAETIRGSLLIREVKKKQVAKVTRFQRAMLYSMYGGFGSLTLAEFVALAILGYPALNTAPIFYLSILALGYGWTGFITALFIPYANRPGRIGQTARASFIASHLVVASTIIFIFVYIGVKA